jgi:uncharacterized protein YjbI with pentapeptide repeats
MHDIYQEKRLELEEERLRIDRQHLAEERKRNRYVFVGGIGALLTVLVSFAAFLATQDSRQRERFEVTVQSLTSQRADIDPSRRLAAANALPHFYNIRSWQRPWHFPFRKEIVHIIATCLKIRAVNRGLRQPLRFPSNLNPEKTSHSESTQPQPEDSCKVEPCSTLESPQDTIFFQSLSYAIRQIGNCDPRAFVDADMEGAMLTGLDLSGARFARCNLGEADFSGARLFGADLSNADLSAANLCETYLVDANLQGTILEGAQLKCANLRGANLERADLQRSDLRGARLQRANLTQANLFASNLGAADLWAANLSCADLQRANLEGAILVEAFLENADLDCATLSEDTVLPDGTKWKPGNDLARFTILKVRIYVDN